MIYVRTPKGETFPLKIPSTTKISKVKDKIKAKKEIPVEDQRLFFNKEPLVDSKTLKDSGVKNGDTIDLDPMKIYVKNPKGKRFTLDVDPAENIRDIMDMVETKEGTPVNQQILHFLKRRLDPQKNIADYRIKHQNVIDLSVGPPVQMGKRCFVEVPESMLPDKDQPSRVETELLPDKTIGDVKKVVEDKLGIPKKAQRVFFLDDTKELDDDTPLASTGIQDGQSFNILPPELEVEMPNGKKRTFFFIPEETVGDFKDRNRAHFPLGERLLFNDEELDDDEKLGDSVKHGDVLCSEPPKIDIELPNKEKISLSATPNLTFEDIKDVVEEKTGVPKSRQRLFHMDNELDDKMPIQKSRVLASSSPIKMVPEEEPEVEIKMPNGKKRPFYFDPEETVGDFKERNRAHLPLGTRLLFNDDEELDDDEKLGDCNIKPGVVLSAEPPMIEIELPNSKKITLATSPKLTFEDVKDLIEEETGVPKSRQRLFYMDNELDDKMPIEKSPFRMLHSSAMPLKMIPDEPSEVQIRMPNGKTRMFIFDPEETVGQFKKRNKQHFSNGFPRLMFNDEELDDDEKLEDCNIKPGVVLAAEPTEVDIELPGAKKIKLSSFPKLTIEDIKDSIEEETGIPKARQRLFYMDNELEDGLPLNKVKLMPGFCFKLEDLDFDDDDDDVSLEGASANRQGILASEPKTVEIVLPNREKVVLSILPTMTIAEVKKILKRKYQK